jgi:hypothetical protein
MEHTAVNVFTKGMTKDINLNDRQNDTYQEAYNVRLTADDKDGTLAISNVKGTSRLHDDVNNIDITFVDLVKPRILGYTTMSDDLIIFVKDDDDSSDYIYLIPYDDDNDTYREMILLSDVAFNFGDNVEAVSVYESDIIKKIYWVDNVNVLRYMNICSDLDDNDVPKDKFEQSNYIRVNSQTLYDFHVLEPVSDWNMPSFESEGTGNLPVGNYCTTYRYFTTNGAYSNVVAVSRMYSVTPEQYRGAEAGTNSRKSVKWGFTVPNDITYDNIELISIRYEDENGTPSVNIIDRRSITPGSFISFVDSGDYIDNLTVEELFTLKQEYIAKTIEIKNNKLFLGNVKETYLDIDELNGGFWDARAYRANSDGYVKIYEDGILNTYLHSDILDGTFVIDEKSDAHNVYNNRPSRLSTSNHCKYQRDSLTLGGEGLNITYSFDLGSHVGHEGNSATFGQFRINPGIDIGSNISHRGIERSLKRGETYRVGIVFIDSIGKKSFVKYIDDIRIPDVWETIGSIQGIYTKDREIIEEFVEYQNYHRLHNCYLNVEVNNIPNDEYGNPLHYQIVYVKRDTSSKSIATQGWLCPYAEYSGVWETRNDSDNWYITEDNLIQAGTYDDAHGLFSPEVNFFQNFNGTFDIFPHSVHESNVRQVIYGSGGVDTFVVYPLINTLSQYPDITNEAIDGFDEVVFKMLPYLGSTSNNLIPFNSDSFNGGTNRNHITGTNSVFRKRGFDTFFSTFGTPSSNYKVLIFDIKPSNYDYENQYGGIDYYSKMANIYIPLSDVTDNSSITCYRGDTFVNFFTATKTFTPEQLVEESAANKQVTISFPVESSLNLVLRHDEHYNTISDKNFRFVQEYDNDIIKGINYFWGNMYQYNIAYSRVLDSLVYFGKPFNYKKVQKSPYTVLYSDEKLNSFELDGFLSFKVNNFIELNAENGELNKLIRFKNNLLGFQNTGFCIIPVDEYNYQNTENVNVIAVGSGNIVGKPVYISDQVGSQYDNDIIKSVSYLYWADVNKKKIYRFNEQLESLNESKGFANYFRNKLKPNSTFTGAYDNEHTEVLMTYSTHDGLETLCFSELFDSFTSFYSVEPTHYLKSDNMFLTFKNYLNFLYKHKDGKYGNWHDKVYDTTIELVLNDSPYSEKQFNNISYISDVRTNDGTESLKTFTKLTAKNSQKSYKDTGIIDLVAYDNNKHKSIYSGGLAVELPDTLANIRRRNRMWHTVFPRIKNDKINNYRFRDYYSMVKLFYDNTNNNNIILYKFMYNYQDFTKYEEKML